MVHWLTRLPEQQKVVGSNPTRYYLFSTPRSSSCVILKWRKMVVVFRQRAHMRAFIEKRFPKVGFSRDVFSERAHMRALAEYRVIMGQRAHMRALAEIDPSCIDSC